MRLIQSSACTVRRMTGRLVSPLLLAFGLIAAPPAAATSSLAAEPGASAGQADASSAVSSGAGLAELRRERPAGE